MHRAMRTSGFTIVELLIVIVVIAILATITIVAYNGVKDTANVASAQNAAEQADKKILAYMALNNDQVPPDLTTAGITASSGTTFQYSLNTTTNPQSFCVTSTTANQSVFVNNSTQTTPVTGACPGHGSGGVAAITNLAPNPSAESTVSLNPAGGATIAASSVQKKTGSNSLLVTLPASAGAGSTGVAIYANSTIPGVFAASTSYMFSAYVYVPTGTVDIRVSEQGTNMTKDLLASNTTSTKNGWTRINDSFTTGLATNTVSLYILNTTATGGTTTPVYVDDIMITQTKTLYNYADPLANPTAWVWNGTVNNSTSTGTPI